MSKTQRKHISSNAVEDARAFLTSGNYKKALDYYRELFKKQPCDEYRNALGDCYLGRAKQLSKSNMNREAIVMWENHFQYCASCDHIYLYITLLLAAEQKDKAVFVFLKHQRSLTASQVFEIEEIFAALLLAANDDFAALFPAESLIRKHLSFIQQALEALANRNFQQLELALESISFRSPYRHLKIILKSYSAQQSGKDSAILKEFLENIPEFSPFYNVAKVVKLVSFPLLDLSSSLSSIDEAEFGLLSGCKGWSADQKHFLDKLRKLPDKANIVALSKLMSECLNHLDKETVKRFYYNIIPFYTPCIKSFEKLFGPMQDQETAHIRARAAAHQSEQLSLEAWLEYERALSLELQTDDIKLKRALTLRHVVSLIDKTHGPNCGCQKSEESLDMLAESLELDPFDKETYLKLIHRHQSKGNKKECKKWADKGLEFFPEDRELLMKGIKIARQHNVSGSALNLTERLLALDPINHFALQNMTELKLEKVKKLVLKRDFEKAGHIMGQLFKTVPHHMQWSVQLYHCLSQYIQGRPSELVLFMQRSLDDILAFTRVLLHAYHFSLSLEQLERDIPAIKKINIAIKDSQQLIEFIRIFDENNFETEKNETIDKLESVIKKAASYPLTVNEFKVVCAFFTKLQRFDLAKVFLKKQSHLKNEPIFIYYHVHTSLWKKNEPLKEFEYDLLIDALEEAEIKKDFSTISLINKLLDDTYIYEEEGDDDPSLKFKKEDVESAMEIFSELVEKLGSKNKNKKKALSELINKVLS